MVLDHVADGAGGVVIRPAATRHAHLFGDRDLHRGNVSPVPHGLEDAVAKSQRQDILHGLLAQVMVDAINLAFVEGPGDVAVQNAGTCEVVAERLFDDDPAPRLVLVPGINKAGGAELLDDRGEKLGCDGQVKHAVPLRAQSQVDTIEGLFQPVVRGWLVEDALGKEDPLGELGPDFAEVGTTGLFQCLLVLAAEVVISPVTAGKADDRAFRRQIAAPGELKQGGNELAVRQVSRGAEEDDSTWVGNPRPGQGLTQGVGFGRGDLVQASS